jgi:hypothetical protein
MADMRIPPFFDYFSGFIALPIFLIICETRKVNDFAGLFIVA